MVATHIREILETGVGRETEKERSRRLGKDLCLRIELCSRVRDESAFAELPFRVDWQCNLAAPSVKRVCARTWSSILWRIERSSHRLYELIRELVHAIIVGQRHLENADR